MQSTKKSAPASTSKSVGKSVSDFRAAHDKSFIVPHRIREALKKLGDEGWEYEGDFIRLASISQSDIGRFRDQFADHLVETRGHNHKRAWAGTKALAAQLRAMVD